jgi:hypothetical protein
VGPGSLFLFLFLFPVRARARETEGEREREHNGEVIAMAAVAMEMRETETVEEEDPLGPPTNPMVSVLLTDMYQLSMAYAYWKAGKHNDSAVYVSSLSLSLSLSLSCPQSLSPTFSFSFFPPLSQLQSAHHYVGSSFKQKVEEKKRKKRFICSCECVEWMFSSMVRVHGKFSPRLGLRL